MPFLLNKSIFFVVFWLLAVLSLPAFSMEQVEKPELTREFSSVSISQRIQKIDEDLFFAPLPDRNLFFSLERVTLENKRNWENYGKTQCNPRVSQNTSQRAKSSGQKFTNDGAFNFAWVLEDEDQISNNEVWIGYITRNPTPTHVGKDIGYYSAETLDRFDAFVDANRGKQDVLRRYLRDKIAENIVMFVTLTSTRHAKIMSPMGISRSAESFSIGDSLGDNLKGLSPSLLSFASQTLLLQNPNLLYMVNAPVPVIPTLLSRVLPPNSLFVGTKRDYANSKDLRDQIVLWTTHHGDNPRPTFDEFQGRHLASKASGIEALANERATRDILEEEDAINQEVTDMMKEDQTSFEQSQQDFIARTKIKLFEYKDFKGRTRKLQNRYFNVDVEIGEDGKLHYTPTYRQARMQTLKNSASRYLWKQMYDETHPPHPAEGLRDKDWVFLMMKYPPILEATSDSIRIYKGPELDEVLLDIKKGDPVYDWIFRKPYHPDVNTKYTAVNIEALAQAALH